MHWTLALLGLASAAARAAASELHVRQDEGTDVPLDSKPAPEAAAKRFILEFAQVSTSHSLHTEKED